MAKHTPNNSLLEVDVRRAKAKPRGGETGVRGRQGGGGGGRRGVDAWEVQVEQTVEEEVEMRVLSDRDTVTRENVEEDMDP